MVKYLVNISNINLEEEKVEYEHYIVETINRFHHLNLPIINESLLGGNSEPIKEDKFIIKSKFYCFKIKYKFKKLKPEEVEDILENEKNINYVSLIKGL